MSGSFTGELLFFRLECGYQVEQILDTQKELLRELERSSAQAGELRVAQEDLTTAHQQLQSNFRSAMEDTECTTRVMVQTEEAEREAMCADLAAQLKAVEGGGEVEKAELRGLISKLQHEVWRVDHAVSAL